MGSNNWVTECFIALKTYITLLSFAVRNLILKATQLNERRHVCGIAQDAVGWLSSVAFLQYIHSRRGALRLQKIGDLICGSTV